MFIKQFYEKTVLLIVLAVLQDTVESTIHALHTGMEGTVMSPGFPELYPPNNDQRHEIRVPPEFSIILEFDFFDLEQCKCDCDYVRIHGGSSALVFCGNQKPDTTIWKNILFIEFRTDGSVNRKGFRATYTTMLNMEGIGAAESERNLAQYFLTTVRQQSRSMNKWGNDITRSAVALFLRNPRYFSAGTDIGEEIAYELSLQLMSKLVMRKRISTNDLALYINAMTVACINPRNFFGVNIVEELHNRIKSANYTNPFLLLTLCNAGISIETEYVHKLQQLFDAPLKSSWTETQAMIVMALKCISRQAGTNLRGNWANMVTKLKNMQHNNGTIGNLKSTALVMQALIATDTYKTDFNATMALKSIVRDMKDTHLSIEKAYYILPIFNLKSLVDVNSNHCEKFYKTDLEGVKSLLPVKVDERMQVQISVIIGDDMDFSRTWRIKVPLNYTLYQALENVSHSEPDYKVQYTSIDGKPYISALAHFEDSVENGLFWFIYRKPLSSSTSDFIRLEDSPVDIWVNETEELVLWYNSGSPIITQLVNAATSDADSIVNTTDADSIMDTTDADSIIDNTVTDSIMDTTVEQM